MRGAIAPCSTRERVQHQRLFAFARAGRHQQRAIDAEIAAHCRCLLMHAGRQVEIEFETADHCQPLRVSRAEADEARGVIAGLRGDMIMLRTISRLKAATRR